MIRRSLFLLIFAGAALFMGGCASDTTATSPTGDTTRVNTIPWNRPERWESQGALGGMLNSR